MYFKIEFLYFVNRFNSFIECSKLLLRKHIFYYYRIETNIFKLLIETYMNNNNFSLLILFSIQNELKYIDWNRFFIIFVWTVVTIELSLSFFLILKINQVFIVQLKYYTLSWILEQMMVISIIKSKQ
jgi:hypothetical protein